LVSLEQCLYSFNYANEFHREKEKNKGMFSTDTPHFESPRDKSLQLAREETLTGMM